MAKISARQIYFFLACVAPVGKLILMPTQLVKFSANDLLFPAAVNFLMQAVVVFLVMLLSRSEKSFYELLSYTFGKAAAKIVTALFSLFLFYAALMPLIEQKLFVQSVFYDTLPSVTAFAPFFLFSAYMCAKPLVSFGRTWDVLAPLSIVGYIGIMALSVTKADFGALMPAGAAGAKGFFSGTAYTMSWFFDTAILLSLMGKFDYRKGMAWKSALFYLAGGAAVLFFLAVFYGIFSDIAVRQIFAFAKISKYFSAVAMLGRIDYIFIFALALVMAFYCALPVQAGTDLLRQAFGGEKALPAVYSICVNLALFLITVLVNYSFNAMNQAVTQTLFWIFPLFCLLLPALCLLLRRSPREKTL